MGMAEGEGGTMGKSLHCGFQEGAHESTNRLKIDWSE